MATVRIIKNIFDADVYELSVKESVSVSDIIKQNSDGSDYDGIMIECYDCDTGETFYVPAEDNSDTLNVIVTVNGKNQSLNYKTKENDIVEVIITPAGGNGGAMIGMIGGAVIGGLIGFALGGPPGALIGAGIGASLMGMVMLLSMDMDMDAGKSSGNLDTQSLPDVRGAQNQPLTDNSYPLVLGKHLCTPFIAGSTWNEISGRHGETNYIHALYAVGYGPLRLTDFRLGEMFVAHNQSWSGNPNLKNVFHGALHGIDENTGDGTDLGDITSIWSSNDITIEILQQSQDKNIPVDYGTVYPYAKVQTDVKANVLFIADGSLVQIDSENLISYKGCGLANGLRNNPIRLTEQYPKSARVELDFKNGLYMSRNEKSGKNNETKYYTIPMILGIQWRVYSEDNLSINGDEHGELSLPVYDYNTKTYVPTVRSGKECQIRGWNSFGTVNGISAQTFTDTLRVQDLNYHTGNKFDAAARQSLNRKWLNAKVFNLAALGGAGETSISEFRCITEVDFVSWARANLLTAEERELPTEEREAVLADKFKAYFFDSSNTTKSVEVRVVRISPCYIDETVSTQDYSAMKFTDLFTWVTLTSTMLDGEKLLQEGIIEQVRPLSENRMRKLCLVALKAKTDGVDQLSNTLRKFSCIAQSFAPYYDSEQKKWFPESVHELYAYHRPDYKDEQGHWHTGVAITREQYLEDRQNGIKSICTRNGNDYVQNLIDGEIKIPENIDDRGRYFIPNDSNLLTYCTNNVASVFLYACIGNHLGIDAMSYEQSFFENGERKESSGDFDLSSFAEWYEWAEDVTDGSTYPSDGTHYDKEGLPVIHQKGEPVHVRFSANAYIYKAETLEQMLSKIAVAGRSVYTKDQSNRFVIVTDKPSRYPKALISQRNTIKSAYLISYNETPSGLQIVFPDENDGYTNNQIYCMTDGEDNLNPRKAIESYKFDFVTNNYQMWSLGRYVLASRIMNKEVVTKTIGAEGYSIALGDTVVLQDDTMLIGTDTGGRITELIEDENSIYGFVLDNTYFYTGETEGDFDPQSLIPEKSRQGVIVMQPQQYQQSRLITLRLARKNTTRTINGKIFKLQRGDTNTVLFDTPMAKRNDLDGAGDFYIFQPKTGNIVGFGIVGNMTATYRVIKIKPDDKKNFELTLMKYQEDIYNYGRELPSFKNNMTIPDRSNEDSFALSDNITHSDMDGYLTETLESAQYQLDSIFSAPPPVPSQIKAIPEQEGIKLSCKVLNSDINLIDYIEYKIVRPDNSETVFAGSYSAQYLFDRETDGYPERLDLEGWHFYARAVGVYTDSEGDRVVSDWGTGTVQLDSYGTWRIPDLTAGINVSKNVSGRTVILSMVASVPSRKLYGTTRFKVSIKRIGIDVAELECNCTLPEVIPDAVFYRPDLYSDFKAHELAYRTSDIDGYEICEGRFSQTLPLAGQSTSNICNTIYQYRIIATNESGWQTNQSTDCIVPVTALCTSIDDFVEANADFKNLVVKNLSVLSANLGVIQQGGMGSFLNQTNYWALSTLFPQDTGLERVVHEGEFRVGDEENYIRVSFDANDKAKVEFHSLAFSVTAETTEFGKSLIVHGGNSLERTVITTHGIYFERRSSEVSDDWSVVSKADISGVRTPAMFSDSTMVISNASMEQRRLNKNDIGIVTPEGALVYHFDDTYLDQNNENPLTFTEKTGGVPKQLVGVEDESTNDGISDFAAALMATAPFCSEARSLYGNVRVQTDVGNAPTAFTVEFWIRHAWEESQQMFVIGDGSQKITLHLYNVESYYNTPLDSEVHYNTAAASSERSPYNEIQEAVAVLEYEHDGEIERINLTELGVRSMKDRWTHIAVILTSLGEFKCIFDKTIVTIPQEEAFTGTVSVDINPSTGSMLLDELLILDGTAMTPSDITANTDTRIPYAHLDWHEKHFVLDVNGSKVWTNLFDSAFYANWIRNYINGTEFTERVTDLINDQRPVIDTDDELDLTTPTYEFSYTGAVETFTLDHDAWFYAEICGGAGGGAGGFDASAWSSNETEARGYAGSGCGGATAFVRDGLPFPKMFCYGGNGVQGSGGHLTSGAGYVASYKKGAAGEKAIIQEILLQSGTYKVYVGGQGAASPEGAWYVNTHSSSGHAISCNAGGANGWGYENSTMFTRSVTAGEATGEVRAPQHIYGTTPTYTKKMKDFQQNAIILTGDAPDAWNTSNCHGYIKLYQYKSKGLSD